MKTTDSSQTKHSAVDFPGNRRVHIGLTASDLDASKRFYQTLLDVAPTKTKPDYAKFEPASPSLNLSLNAAASFPASLEPTAARAGEVARPMALTDGLPEVSFVASRTTAKHPSVSTATTPI